MLLQLLGPASPDPCIFTCLHKHSPKSVWFGFIRATRRTTRKTLEVWQHQPLPLMLSKLVANVATDVSCTTFGKSCRFQNSSTKSIRRQRTFFCQAPRPCQEAQVKLHLGSISPDTTCSKLAVWRRESFSQRQQLQKRFGTRSIT